MSGLGKFDFVMLDMDVKTPFFWSDRIHLNEVGLEYHLDFLRDASLKTCPIVS